MHTAAQSLPSAILALLPSPHLRDFLKALRFLLLQGQAPAQPDQVPRFLNSYPWPTRALIRLARQEAETTLHRARRRRGPKPRLLVVLDPVTLEKRGTFPLLPLSFLASGACIWWCFTWSTVSFGCPGSVASGEVKARRAFPSWPRGFSRPCPPGGGRPLVFGWWPTPPSAPSASARGRRGWAWRRWWGCGGIGGRGRVSAS